MADNTDNHLIAAQLAAALISKHVSTSFPAKDAARMYFDVLKALEDEQAARHGADVSAQKEDLTAAVVASRPVDEPKDAYGELDDDDRAL